MTERDRRALLILGAALLVMAVVYFWPEPSVEVVGSGGSDVKSAAVRLDQVRKEAALLPVRSEALQLTNTALTEIEKGLIAAETAPQAQAQLLQIVRRVSKLQSPGVELKQNQFGQVRPFGDDYAQIVLSISMDCQIEELVTFLSDIASQPELLAVDELHISATNNKQKSIPVQMMISGLVKGSLLKKQGGSLR